MHYKILKIVWKDITYSDALMSKEEAIKLHKPTSIITFGFKVDETEDAVSIAQTINTTANTFIKTNIIPKKLIEERIELETKNKDLQKDKNLAVVTWYTNNKYMTKNYTKEQAKKLLPTKLLTIGILVEEDTYYSLFFEKENNADLLARSEQRLYKSEVKSVEFI